MWHHSFEFSVLAVLALALTRVPTFAASTWSHMQHDAQRTGFTSAIINLPNPPKTNWTANMPSSSSLFLRDNTVFATNSYGLIGYDAKTGYKVYQSDNGKRCQPGDPAFARDGEIFICCPDMLMRLDKTGAVVDYWEGKFVAGCSPILSPQQNTLAVLADKGLTGFTTRPLKPVWNTPISAIDGRGTIGPDGSIYLVDSTGIVIFKYSPDGKSIFNTSIGGGNAAYATLDSAALCNNRQPTIFITTSSGIVALDATTGRRVGSYTFGSYHGRRPSPVRPFPAKPSSPTPSDGDVRDHVSFLQRPFPHFGAQ